LVKLSEINCWQFEYRGFAPPSLQGKPSVHAGLPGFAGSTTLAVGSVARNHQRQDQPGFQVAAI
jgi:hypothetical protein